MVFEHKLEFNPEDWPVCRGPANWFRFRCPPGLVVRQNETIFEITPEAGRSWGEVAAEQSAGSESAAAIRRPPSSDRESPPALLICAAWVEDASAREVAFDDVSALFPRVAVMRSEPALRTRGSRNAWSGISTRKITGRWWQKLFVKRSTYQWRFWSLQRKNVLVAASIQSSRRRALNEDAIALCECILNSLELADAPCWPPDVFQREVVRLGRRTFPLLKIEPAAGFCVAIEESEISLANFYRCYLQKPDQFSRIVLPGLTTVVRLRELGPDQILPSLDTVRSRILPMLSSEDELRSEELVRNPWVGGLTVGYVVDEDDAYRFVHRRMLQHWGLDTGGLHDLAMENLQCYSQEHPLEVTMVGDEGNPQMLMPVKPDAYNSSRILDPGFHGKLRELFGPELVVGVPNRDFFVAVSLRHPGLVQQVQDRVSRDHATMHHPLTQRLLVISADGVSEFVDE